MDAAVLVPTMAALNVMRFPLWTLPHIFGQVSRGYLALTRIENYLNLHSDARASKADSAMKHKRTHTVEKTPSCVNGKGYIKCDGCSFAWKVIPSSSQILRTSANEKMNVNAANKILQTA